MTNKYKEYVNEESRHKEFDVGYEVTLYLRKERFTMGKYKMKMRKYGPCKILKKFDLGKTYEVELPETLGYITYF